MTASHESSPSRDYSAIDIPEVLSTLFHPRPEPLGTEIPEACEAVHIPVDEKVSLGARFYKNDAGDPLILFFHGNGEIAADYDDIAVFFIRA